MKSATAEPCMFLTLCFTILLILLRIGWQNKSHIHATKYDFWLQLIGLTVVVTIRGFCFQLLTATADSLPILGR